jgi:hypothetical protein
MYMFCRNQKKCMNEKRRREQETVFMEELAEYISGTVSDVNKAALMKQDKCAILHETVTLVKSISTDHGMYLLHVLIIYH